MLFKDRLKHGSREIGGGRPIGNGFWMRGNQAGYNIDPKYVPMAGDGCLPAGMAVCCNETTKEMLPFKVAEVVAVSGTKVTIASQKEYNLSPFMVGESIIKLGDDLTEAATASATISKIENTDSATEITLSGAISGLAEGDYIVLADEDKKPIGVPNALLQFDKVNTGDDYIFAEANTMYNGQLYARRIPVMPAVVKTALLNAGCKFSLSETL